MKDLTEKELEDFLWLNPNLIDISGWLGRQIIVPMGVIDLLGIDIYGNLTLIELKAVPYKSKHITQLNRYQSCLFSLAAMNGLVPIDIYKALVIPHNDHMSECELFEIHASDVWLFTYNYNASDRTIFFNQPFNKAPKNRYPNFRSENNQVNNYLKYVMNNQPTRRHDGAWQNPE